MRLSPLVLLIPSLWLVGCATEPVVVHSERTTLVRTGDFEPLVSLGHWRWHPEFTKALLKDRGQEAEAVDLLKAEIRRVLEGHGYPYSEAQNGFVVGFGAAVEERVSDDTLMSLTGLSPGLSLEPGTDKGTLMIALFNPGAAAADWRVQLQGYTHDELTGVERRERLHQLISQMLATLPTKGL